MGLARCSFTCLISSITSELAEVLYSALSSFKPRGSHLFWKVQKHGAFSIPRKTLGLRPNDQSCHHETWLHPDFVDWSKTWSKQDVHEQRISLKERPADCSYGNPKRRISEVMSDHSLSS